MIYSEYIGYHFNDFFENGPRVQAIFSTDSLNKCEFSNDNDDLGDTSNLQVLYELLNNYDLH